MQASHPARSRARSSHAPGGLRWQSEVGLAAALIAFGLVALPAAVYLVGLQVIGEYESQEGLRGLMSAVWRDLAAGHPAAWILVLSPYAVIQLLRLAAFVWRARSA
jgi:hypothetical protein